jgi:hypothetical protein
MSNISIVSTSHGQYGISTGDSALLRVAPEPKNSLGSWMSSIASTGLSVARSVVPGIDGLAGGDLTSLLNMQIQIQQQMQVVSMVSNVERSRHETEMAPIRNMRVG